MSKPTKYEYQVCYYPYDHTTGALTKELNEMAAKGWKLHTFLYSENNHVWCMVVFERPAKDDGVTVSVLR